MQQMPLASVYLVARDRLPSLPEGARAAVYGDRLELTGPATLAAEVLRVTREHLGPYRVLPGRRSPFHVLFDLLVQRGAHLVVAESCTGGQLGQRMTDLPGSSAVFWGGLITYADSAKQLLLQVPAELLRAHGAVSPEVAAAMARGAERAALTACDTPLAIAVTGVAGPGGGTDTKPVGLVWVHARVGETEVSQELRLSGDRAQVRARAAIVAALTGVRALTGQPLLDTPYGW